VRPRSKRPEVVSKIAALPDDNWDSDPNHVTTVPCPAYEALEDIARGGLRAVHTTIGSGMKYSTFQCPACDRAHEVNLADLLPTIGDRTKGVTALCRTMTFIVFLEQAEYDRALEAEDRIARCTAARLRRIPPRIVNDSEYASLPPGTRFIAPDGSTRTKPMLASNQIH
jgi:hypothetical protein